MTTHLTTAVAVGAIAAGCAHSTTADDTRHAALRFYAAVNESIHRGDTTAFDTVLARDAVDHDPTPGMLPGRDGIVRAFAELRASFPDYHGEVEDIVVEGDKAACRITGRMTHAGTTVVLRGIDILRFRDGLLVERWGHFDSPPR